MKAVMKKTANMAAMKKAVKKTANMAAMKAIKPVAPVSDVDRKELMKERFATLEEEAHYMVVMAYDIASRSRGKNMKRVAALLDNALMML